MDYQNLANLLYKNTHTTPEYYYEKLNQYSDILYNYLLN